MREDEIDALLDVMGIDLSPFDENAEFAKPKVDDYLGDGDVELPIKGEVAVNTDKAYSVDYAKVKGARRASGYTQKKVAELIGMHASSYCQFERGNKGIKKDQLEMAAKLFGIDYEDCFYKKNTYAGSEQQQAAELNKVLPVNSPVRSRASSAMLLNAEKKKNLLLHADGLRQGLAIMVGKENVEPVLAICRSIIQCENDANR
jgi:transcriptional regulator with XRE-family HTH domain